MASWFERFREDKDNGVPKTLFVQNPWAEWIAEGKKTMEVRGWGTHYRGPILICSSKTYQSRWGEGVFSAKLGKDWENGKDYHRDAPRGVTICEVELLDIIWEPAESKAKRAASKRAMWDLSCAFGTQILWVFGEPRRVAPVPVKGHLWLEDFKGEVTYV
jgi:hypothetical protein